MDSVAFIATQGGLIGLEPPGTQQGDLIAIVNGAAYPFVVRVVQGAEFFVLVGPCYVHGAMSKILTQGPEPEMALINRRFSRGRRKQVASRKQVPYQKTIATFRDKVISYIEV